MSGHGLPIDVMFMTFVSFQICVKAKKMIRSIVFTVVGATLVIATILHGFPSALAAPETGPCNIMLIGYNTDPHGGCYCASTPDMTQLFYCTGYKYNAYVCQNSGGPCTTGETQCFANLHTTRTYCPYSSACSMDCTPSTESCKLWTPDCR